MSNVQASTAVLASALRSSDVEERRQATSHLGDLPRDDAIPLLLCSLGDSDWRVRKEATVAARSFAADRALVEALLARLSEPAAGPAGFADVGLRNAIVEVLAGAGSAATALIAERMSALDGDGRKLAVEILGKSGDPAAVTPLAARLDDGDDNVREAAVEAIASLGGLARERVLAVLERCLDDRDRFVRLTALEGLNALGAALPWERLEPLVADPTLRGAALSAAANSDSPRAAPALARALASSRGGGFHQAQSALFKMADGPHAARVVEALRSQGPEVGERLLAVAERQEPVSEPPVRSGGFEGFAPEGSTHPRAMALVLAAAARAQGVAGAAIEALSEQALNTAASRALCMLGTSALAEVVQRLEQGLATQLADPLSTQADAHVALVDVAGTIARSAEATVSDRALVLGVLRLAARSDRRVATSAIFQLSRFGEADDLRLCAELALSRDAAVAHAAEGALTALAVRHPEEARRLAASAAQNAALLPAVLVIGALGSTAPVLSTTAGDLAFLEQAATSGDTRTRCAAVAAVAEMGATPSGSGATSPFDVLSYALTDEERSVQLAAARALGRLCVRASEGASSPPPPRSERDLSGGRMRLAAPRPSDVLELVGRSQDEDLLAATVRALADAAALSSRSLMSPPSPRIGALPVSEAEELIAALAPLAQDAPSAVAIAAVEALARAPAEEGGRLDALIGALDHPDHGVVEATVLKLGSATIDDSRDGRVVREALTRCLSHSSAEVRALAAERLAESTPPGPGEGQTGGRGRERG